MNNNDLDNKIFIRKCLYSEQPIKRLFWFNLFF